MNFWEYRRQPFPYLVAEEWPVIRPQSEVCHSPKACHFPMPDYPPMRVDPPHDPLRFGFERCLLSHRLLDPDLVEWTWNLRALGISHMEAGHFGAVQD